MLIKAILQQFCIMPTQRQRKAALRYIVAFVCIISSKRKCTPRAEKTPAVKRK